jgi:hypothetical protein
MSACVGEARSAFTEATPAGVGHELGWLAEVSLSLYDPPPEWPGWRVLARGPPDREHEVFKGKQLRREAAAYEVGRLHASLHELPPPST